MGPVSIILSAIYSCTSAPCSEIGPYPVWTMNASFQSPHTKMMDTAERSMPNSEANRVNVIATRYRGSILLVEEELHSTESCHCSVPAVIARRNEKGDDEPGLLVSVP
jgi:hypothetical protein